MLLLMRDFNAKLGCQAEQWAGAIGRLGLPAPITDNGKRLLALCMAHSLVVTDTMFQHKAAHLQIWVNPKATDTTKHQIDHTIFRRRDVKCVQDTRVFRGADVDSDHRLMISKMQLRFHKRKKHTLHPRFQPAPLHTEEGRTAFQQSMSTALSPHHLIPITDVEHSWDALHSALMLTSQAQLRQSPKPRKPWISQSTMLLAEQKHQLWRAWQASQTPAAKALYKAANRASRQAAVADYQQHWSSQLAQVQNSMRKGDLHSAYRCLNQLSKPKAQLSRTLHSKHTGRLLQSIKERIADWTSHTTVLLASSTPIPPSTIAPWGYPKAP